MPTLTVHPDAPSWLAHRRRRLTSSDCCVLLGLGWGDANVFKLWFEKVHGGVEPDRDLRRRWEAGHHFEALMHRWTEEEIGEPLYDLGDYAIVEHDGGILSCTTDRVLADEPFFDELDRIRAIVSFKTADRAARRGYQESKGFAYAMTQAHVEMMCCGVEEGWISTSFGLGDDFLVTPIVKNDHLCEVIEERAASFWPYVLAQEVPPPSYVDESAAIGDALSAIYAGETGETKVLGEEWATHLVREQELRQEIKERTEELQTIKNLAARELEGASFGVVPGCPRKMKWAKRTGGGFHVDPWEKWGVSFVKA